MKRCIVCGMASDDNPAHSSSYKGVGSHAFAIDEEQASPMDDILVSLGGQLKSLGEGKFEGYLVRFSSADDPDLVGDFFTKSTEFFVEDGAVIPILYDHGLNATMKKTKIGRAKVSYDDAGLFIKGELETRADYEKFVNEINSKLVKPGKAGLSSGAASHMVERKQVKKGVNEITSWGIAEGSITPAPTEPRCEVVSLKSYFDHREDPIESEQDNSEIKTVKKETRDGEEKYVLYTKDGTRELGVHDTMAEAMAQETAIEASKKKKTKSETEIESDPEEDLAASVSRPMKTIFDEKIARIKATDENKALFEQKLKEKVPSVWELRSTLDDVYKDVAMAASIEDITGSSIDIETKVKEAKTEQAAREIPIVVAQIKKWVEAGGSKNGENRYFYLRCLPDTELAGESIKGNLGNGLILDEHSDRVVHAVEEYTNLGVSLVENLKALEQRCIKKIEYREKDPDNPNRTLARSTIEKLTAIKGGLAAHKEKVKEIEDSINNLLLTATKKPTPDVADVLSMEFDLTRLQTSQALQGLLSS